MASRHRKARKRKRRFAIFCEGQTEREYFRSFPEVSVTVYPPRDPVGDRKKLLKDALRLIRQEDYDEVWMVFDLDYTPARGSTQIEAFERTIREAEKAGLEVAWSVDAFELWFCLHYVYTEQRLDRTAYYQQLSDRWTINYEREGKRRQFAKDIRQRLLDDPMASEAEAIRRARKLVDRFGSLPLHERNPITTVYQLVEALLNAGNR